MGPPSAISAAIAKAPVSSSMQTAWFSRSGISIVEAYSAEVITNDGHTVPATVVGYDHETGFGLLRTLAPLKVRPLPLGKYSDVKENDNVVVASGGGSDNVARATIVSKREFVGNWEYALSEAYFTSPPHASWSGARADQPRGQTPWRWLADCR